MDIINTKNQNFRIFLFAAIFTIAHFAFLSMFYNGDNNISPDSADYYNIARNIAEGNGFIHSIKWHFFNDDPVIHAAAGERPPLYPIILSCVLAAGGGIKSCVLLTMFMGAAASSLLFIFLCLRTKKIFLSFLVYLVVILNPNSLRCFSYLWTESLYFLLMSFVFLLLPINFEAEDVKENDQSSSKNISADDIKIFLAGGLSAMSYLARPSGLFLIASVFVWFMFLKKIRRIVIYSVPIVVILGVWFLTVYRLKGDPFYSIQKYHAVVMNIRDGMASGFDRIFPASFYEHFAINPYRILSALEQSFRTYASELTSGMFLSFLAWFIIIIPISNINKKAILFFSLLATLNFIGHSLVWATSEGFRFMLFSFIPLIPLIIFAAYENNIDMIKPGIFKIYKYIFTALLIFLFVQYLKFDFLFYKTMSFNKGLDNVYKSYVEYFNKALDKEDIIASEDPFYLNYKTDKPSIQLPDDINPSNLYLFMNKFNVKCIMVSNDSQSRVFDNYKNGMLKFADNAPRFPFSILIKTQE